MAIVAKRTIISLYSDNDNVYSHQVRIVLAAKGVNVEIIPTNSKEIPDSLMAINPYGTVPTLIDRELVLYKARIIMEYLDERFPHPPLLPVYPVARAETRKMIHRIQQDWYRLMHNIYNDHNKEDSKKRLLDSLVSLEAIFGDKPYFLSDEFSLLDCALAPLLWRLPQMEIILPTQAKGIHSYLQRIFSLEAFQASLTDTEKQLRVA